MGAFRRRNKNGWRRCGFCGVACRGQKAHLEHIAKCDVVNLAKLLKKDLGGVVEKDSLILPTDFVFKSTSRLISEAKPPAIRAKK